MTDDQLRKIPAPSPSKSNGDGVERKLDDAIRALTKACEVLAVDNIPLRCALLRGAISVAEMNIRDILGQVEAGGKN